MRPIILRSLLPVATPHTIHYTCVQHTATHCNTLQHAATHCNTLQLPVATPYNTLYMYTYTWDTIQHMYAYKIKCVYVYEIQYYTCIQIRWDIPTNWAQAD